MFIHFAFGLLGKQGKTEEQTTEVIEKILKPKNLRACLCKEFIPSFPIPGSIPLPIKPIQRIEKDSEGHKIIWFAEVDMRTINQDLVYPKITFLPHEVPMICFINITFDHLKRSPHTKEYGRFGIVLTTKFLKSHMITPVAYYTEESLWHDPVIIAWNKAALNNDHASKAVIEKQIIAYRKPATYFPSFAKLTTIHIKMSKEINEVSSYKYDRYPIGYDFRHEHENRIVFNKDGDLLKFTEEDVLMLIVPNKESENLVNKYLNQEWKYIPALRVFPD